MLCMPKCRVGVRGLKVLENWRPAMADPRILEPIRWNSWGLRIVLMTDTLRFCSASNE